MPLTHLPSHTVDYPDRFEDDKTGLGYSVVPDAGAEDPRDDIDNEHAALWAYNEPRTGSSIAADKPEGNLAINAFARYYETCDEDPSLALTKRYLAAYHPDEKISVAIQTIRGNTQGEWLDVVCAVSEGFGTPESHINEFRMWAFGDVWIVIPDGKPGVAGIYADDAESALEYFRENYEQDTQPVPESNGALDPLIDSGLYAVTWTIDSDEGLSPAQAALRAWQKNFRRGTHQPSNEEACVFAVLDPSTGWSVDIDLSDSKFAHLFR